MPTMSTRDNEYLFPADPTTRGIALDLYESVASARIISPHGHVSSSLLTEDRPFSDPTDLLITHDHYVTRVLHSAGYSFDRLGIGPGISADPRAVWRIF